MGFIYNDEGVSRVQQGYKTIIYNSNGGKEFVEVKQLPDSQGVHGTTKWHSSIVRGSMNEAILAAKNTIARMPGAMVQVVDAATGEVTVYTKHNVGMSAYEQMRNIAEAKSLKRGRKPMSVVEQVKAAPAPIFEEVTPVDAFIKTTVIDPTTMEGAYRITVGFEGGKAVVYDKGNAFAKKTGSKREGVVAHKYASKEELLAEREAERKGAYTYSADEVPSLR